MDMVAMSLMGKYDDAENTALLGFLLGGGGNSMEDKCIDLYLLGLEASLQCLMDDINPLHSG